MNAITDTSAARLGEDFALPPAALMLWALKSAYTHLEDCIAQMETATNRSQPDMAALANARFRISQASLARRHLLHKACDHLLEFATAAEAETIGSLKRESIAYAGASTEHIRQWPAAKVEKDWTAYRDASRKIRARMKQAMRVEQRLLLPLLARYEQY